MVGPQTHSALGPKTLANKLRFSYNQNMTRFFSALFICVFLCAGLPARAQISHALKNLPNIAPAAEKAAAQALLRQHSLRAVLPLLKRPNTSPTTLAAPAIPANIRRSVFTVQATAESKHKGSAFAVNIDGRIWGVTARHVMDDIGHTPYMTFPGKNEEPVTLLAQPSKEGSVAGADVALFEIPAQALPYLLPLELEEELPSAHTLLASSGFAHGNFLSQPKREVLFASQYRILTKYESFNAQESGYCGSPLMSNGKVAAVHIGSMPSEKLYTAAWYSGTLGRFNGQMHSISLAVPAAWLRALARQAQGVYTAQEGAAVIFNGLEILVLQPKDSINFIMQLRNGRVLKSLPRYPFMDFAHLETFFDVLPGDVFRLEAQLGGENGITRQKYWYEWTAGENRITKTLQR